MLEKSFNNKLEIQPKSLTETHSFSRSLPDSPFSEVSFNLEEEVPHAIPDHILNLAKTKLKMLNKEAPSSSPLSAIWCPSR